MTSCMQARGEGFKPISCGRQIFREFLENVCGASSTSSGSFAPSSSNSSSRQVGSGRRLNRALRPPPAAADLRAAVSSLSTAGGRWIQSVPQPQPARQCCTYLQSLSLVNVLVIICEVNSRFYVHQPLLWSVVMQLFQNVISCLWMENPND